jgi:hypothetical protein
MEGRSRIAAVASLVLASLTAAGCGAASSSSAPAMAAKRFIAAIDRGDTRSWCPQIGAGFLELHRTGPLPRPLLQQCETADLFLIMGYCEREAVVARSSVTAESQNGDRAKVTLSSGAQLQMSLEQHAWLVEHITGGHASGRPPAGRCSYAPGTSV